MWGVKKRNVICSVIRYCWQGLISEVRILFLKRVTSNELDITLFLTIGQTLCVTYIYVGFVRSVAAIEH